jgi:gluconolactonase
MGDYEEPTVVATGLEFPEGPVAMADGSVVLVEIKRGTLTRVQPDGATEVVAECGGGPNGAAIGPDGAFWLCNNGAFFTWNELGDLTIPGETPAEWAAGSIQRVDAATGAVTDVVTECEGQPLRAPNDLVFDRDGGIWFTDHGVTAEFPDRAGVLYRSAEGTVHGVATGLQSTNGIGLSPEGDRLYVAETHTGRVWAWGVTGPGRVGRDPSSDTPHGGTLLFDAPEGHLFDSLGVDGDGFVCVATLGQGGVTVVAPDGSSAEHIPMDDPLITNICFGGEDGRTAFLTSSGKGRLLRMRWPRRGLTLNFTS